MVGQRFVVQASAHGYPDLSGCCGIGLGFGRDRVLAPSADAEVDLADVDDLAQVYDLGLPADLGHDAATVHLQLGHRIPRERGILTLSTTLRVRNKAQAKEAQVLARKGDLDRGFKIPLHRGQRNVQRNVEPSAPEVIGTPSAVLQRYRHLIVASGQFVASEEVVGVVGFLGDRLGALRWKHYKALGGDSRAQIDGIKLALHPPLATGCGKA